MALGYLISPVIQVEDVNGKPLVGGRIRVYRHGTQIPYITYKNWMGDHNPAEVILDAKGMCILIAEDEYLYDVYCEDRNHVEQWSRLNVGVGGGGGSGSGTPGELQHWLGMYGPTYVNFPGDEAGHTLGIPTNEVEYVGDFIDHISTCPYPDSTPPGYIYLKPGLYYVSCIIRYQQSSDDLSNTLDEVLIYTGHGNANEDVAYQLDASGPDTNGNRHCLKQSFIRKVTENDGGLLYFAPGTPTDWKDAYIQTLSIVKLDSIALSPTIVQGLEKVTHDNTMTGDGTVMNPLSIQDSLDGKQDILTPGEGINLDSDGNISVDTDDLPTEPVDFSPIVAGHGITIEDSDGETVISATGEVYSAGYGILIDSDNEISVDPSVIQNKITAGEGLTLDSDGNLNLDLPPIIPLVAGDGVTLTDSDGELIISAEGRQYTAGEGIDITSDGVISADLPEEEEVEFEELDLDDYQKKLTAGQNIEIDSDGVISATGGGEPCLWFLDSDGLVQPKDGKHFETYGAPSYSQAYDYYYAMFNRARSTNGGFEVDSLVASHRGADTEWGNPNVQGIVKTVFSSNPYMGAAQAGLTVLRGTDGSGQESRVDLRAGSPGTYTEQSQVENTYVQAYRKGNYIRVRSDDIIHHVGNVNGHAPFVLAHQSDTTKTYVMQPTATAGIYELVEETSGGGGTYSAGGGINIDSDGEVSVKTGSGVTIDSDGALTAELPEEEPVQFEEFDPSDYQTKLTAGQGINIANDIISVDSDSLPAGQDGTTPPVVPLVAGANISITESNNSVVIAATGLATSAQLQEVESEIPDVSGFATKTELADKADAATTIAGYGITDAYTKTEVDSALSSKQGTLTGITDVQVVQSLPASPVATVLYLIPEA